VSQHPTPAEAQALLHQQVRDARRKRAYGYLRVSTEAARKALDSIESPKINLPHRGLKTQ